PARERREARPAQTSYTDCPLLPSPFHDTQHDRDALSSANPYALRRAFGTRSRRMIPSSLARRNSRAGLDTLHANGHFKSAGRRHLRGGGKNQKSQRVKVPIVVWTTCIGVYCWIVKTCSSPLPLREFRLNFRFNGQGPRPTLTATAETMEQQDIVHVVQTRFMQGQSGLLELGRARLALFETFCLPSMLAQSSTDFIWIVRIDPMLDSSLVSDLVEMLQGRQQFFLIGSNANPEGFGRTAVTPFSDYLGDATVLTGNITLLENAYGRSSSSVYLETRLDADDGLHRDFIRTLQLESQLSLMKNGHPVDPWRLWCVHATMEYHPFNPGICVTPGLTFGYGGRASRESIGFERLRHDQIVKKIKACNKEDDNEVQCVSRLRNLVPGAVRARTATSAGKKVQPIFVYLSVSADVRVFSTAAGMSNVITGNATYDKTNGGCGTRNF
ncbi:hypothetical protein THAOC_10574, partial [Thalassiosira oceanica]